jgi:hypothetical protein
MLDRMSSGGQTGADQAGWRVACAFGIPDGGSMPKGFLAEDRPRPEFAELYRAQEMPTVVSAAPTRQNICDSDATLWSGTTDARDVTATFVGCRQNGKSRVQV